MNNMEDPGFIRNKSMKYEHPHKRDEEEVSQAEQVAGLDHDDYLKHEEHHIMSQRKKDHGYSPHEDGQFKHFSSKESNPGEYDEHMENFRHHLHRVGHPAKPDHHYRVGHGDEGEHGDSAEFVNQSQRHQ